MSSPILTIILPVHNGMPYLKVALQSILDQTFEDFKVLAIDDGSSDGSGEYLDSVGDPRLEVLHQSQSGLGAVLNRGIDLCDTPFIARMDADDIALPHRLEQQMDCLQRHEELVAIGSPLNFLVGDEIQQGLPYPTGHDEIVKDLLSNSSSFSHPTLLMRTEAAKATRYRIGGAGEDLDFCLRLCEYGKVTNLAAPQYLYRLHESSLSMTRESEIECGYAFARLTAIERGKGLPETEFSEFAETWCKRSMWQKIKSQIIQISLRHYRNARISWARRSYLRSAIHLCVSVLLQPLRSARLLTRRSMARPIAKDDVRLA